ncbi:45442_t:CDS:1, partial [Gigaspora margarita]
RDVLVLLTEPKLALAENITDSNHKIVSTELVLVYPLKTKRRKRIKYKRYLYDRIFDENWQNFTDSLEKKIEKRNPAAKMIDNTATLNTIWNTWDNLVKAEDNKHIPFTYSAQKTFHSHTFKATNIHRDLTLVNKILKCIKSPVGPIILCQVTIAINKLMAKVVKLTQLEIEELAPDNLCTANYSITGQKFRIIRNTLFMARKLEIQKSKSESINFYINRRYNNFASNTTKIIDSVLLKHKTAVTYHNLVTPSEVITDPEEILEAIQKHLCI